MQELNNHITKQVAVWVKVNSEYEDKHLFSDIALRYDYLGMDLTKVKISIHDTPTSKARKWKIDVAELDTSDNGVQYQTVLNDALRILGILAKLEFHRSISHPWTRGSEENKKQFADKTNELAKELMFVANEIASQSSPYYNTSEKLDRLCSNKLDDMFTTNEIEYVKVKRTSHDHTKILFEWDSEAVRAHTAEMKKRLKKLAENCNYGAIDGKSLTESDYINARHLMASIGTILGGTNGTLSSVHYDRLIKNLRDAESVLGCMMCDGGAKAVKLADKVTDITNEFVLNNESNSWLHDNIVRLLKGEDGKDVFTTLEIISKIDCARSIGEHAENTKKESSDDTKSIPTLEELVESVTSANNILLHLHNLSSGGRQRKNNYNPTYLILVQDELRATIRNATSLWDRIKNNKIDIKSKLQDACDKIHEALCDDTLSDETKCLNVFAVVESYDIQAVKFALIHYQNVANSDIMLLMDKKSKGE